MNSSRDDRSIRGRGARANIDHRFTGLSVEAEAAEWEADSAKSATAPATQILPLSARSLITRNTSPDVGFDRSINPYQGCEHGCVYCFARPTHAWHDLSPGLDFETRILAKTNAEECLRRELAAASYRCRPIAIGVNTDAYQPAERDLGITRRLLETCLEFRQPALLITKSRGVLRDRDLLAELAARKLVRVSVSVTTLDKELKRRLEPRTAGPNARLTVIRELSAAGVPVSAMVAPVIPRINDQEMERILEAVASQGALSASYVLLRLPHEVEPLFRDWLQTHYPQRAAAVMNAVAACHRGQAYRGAFHLRMRGDGVYADMIAARFSTARRRLGLDRSPPPLDTTAFRRPASPQGELFL